MTLGQLIMLMILDMIYTFSINQKNVESAHSITLKLKFYEKFPEGIYGYALVLTNKLVSKSSDVQKHFNLN